MQRFEPFYMLREIIKVVLILCAIPIIAFIILMIILQITFNGFDKDYSVSDLKENFYEKKSEIYEVKNYLNSITSLNNSVHIEFDDSDRLGIFHVNINGKFENNWDVEINSSKADSLLNSLGWNKENLMILKSKLDKANCIGVSSGEPCVISFQRSGMGIYSFLVFDDPIPNDQKSSFNDSCSFIMVNDKLVLEFSGGVLGSQCFYNLN